MLDITILNNALKAERNYEWHILLCQILFAFREKKQLTTLNNIRVLLKGVLTDLHACNFVHAKTSTCPLPACSSLCAQFVEPCETSCIFEYICWATTHEVTEHGQLIDISKGNNFQ